MFKRLFDSKQPNIVSQGSQLFVQIVPAISAGVTLFFDVVSTFPQARQFEPLDSLLITNNDAQNIIFYLDSLSDAYPILAYQIQPISRRAFRRWGIWNQGAIATLSTTITVQMRRLPPDVVATTNVR